MIESPELVVISQNPSADQLCAALQNHSVAAVLVSSYSDAARSDAARVLAANPGCVCVIDNELPPDLAGEVATLALQSQTRRTVILADPESCNQARKRGLPIGVDLCPRGENVEETVLRLKAFLLLAGYNVGILAPSPSPLTALTADRSGEVIAVFGVKGGVGKTTISVNLAVGLARVEDRKTLLVDADLYFGDVSVLLDIAPKRSVFDLCDLSDLDAHMLMRLVSEHASGVSILSSPPDLTTVELLTAERLATAISRYRDAFDNVVVDMPSALNEHTLQILDVADRILLATTPEVSAIHQTGRFISLAETLGYRDKIQLILNRADAGVSPASVEEILQTRVEATVVSAGRAAVAAGNRGTPLLLNQQAQKEEIGRDFARLVDLVGGTLPVRPKARPRGFFRSKADQLMRSVAV